MEYDRQRSALISYEKWTLKKESQYLAEEKVKLKEAKKRRQKVLAKKQIMVIICHASIC